MGEKTIGAATRRQLRQPESLVLQLLRDMRAEIGDMRADTGDMRGNVATKADVADLRSEMTSLRADVAADMIDLRTDLSGQIVGLRRAVVEYHTSVTGHGIIISELEARLRRVEQHLDLPSIDAP